MKVMINKKIFVMLAIVILVFTYYIYKFLMYPKINFKGFCIPEMKQLSNEERRQKLIRDRIIWELVAWDNYDRHPSQNNEKIYISKYDLADREDIIRLMQKADINKSFEDNFGVVAKADIEEHASKRRCIRRAKEMKRECDFDSNSKKYIPPHIHNLYTEDNKIDVDYINAIPENYSFILHSDDYSVRIRPMSQVKILDNNDTQEVQYDITNICCDNQAIREKLKSHNDTVKFYEKKGEKTQSAFAYGQPNLTLDEIDGRKINSSYIYDLYRLTYFTDIEQVQKYGLLESVASLKFDKEPYKWTYQVSACGNYVREIGSIFDNYQTQD